MGQSATILFGHAAYQLGDAFRAQGGTYPFIEVRDMATLEAHLPEADVLVVSRFWRNDLLDRAPRLRYIQSVSAGTDQYDLAAIRAKGIRLASAQGANANAVAEHAFALMLALSRRIHHARDDQQTRTWRGPISDLGAREMELSGRTMLVLGLGGIGLKIAALGKAFGMTVLGMRRRPAEPGLPVDEVLPPEALMTALPRADVVVIACPLTPETDGLMGDAQFAAMKRSAFLINVSRGRIVDEVAIIRALSEGVIAAAGLDCFREEPLPVDSPLWGLKNALLTPHHGGETRRYEEGVIAILQENLGRLSRGETRLVNEVV